jgi:hypothetical protein
MKNTTLRAKEARDRYSARFETAAISYSCISNAEQITIRSVFIQYTQALYKLGVMYYNNKRHSRIEAIVKKLRL